MRYRRHSNASWWGGVLIAATAAALGAAFAVLTPLPSAAMQTQEQGYATVASTAAESCHVFKTTGAELHGLSGYTGQAEFIMVFDAIAAPADGAVTPIVFGYSGGAGFWGLAWLAPMITTTGLTVCYSSTGPLSKTAISTNNVMTAQFK